MHDPHPTQDMMDRFRRSDLDIAEIAAIVQHLDRCPECRRRYWTEPVEMSGVRSMETELLLLAWTGDEHLPDEQIVALGEGDLIAADQQEAAVHLEQCALCSSRVERVRSLHTLLSENPELVVSPLPGSMNSHRTSILDTNGLVGLHEDRVQLPGARKLHALPSGWIQKLLTEGSVAPSKPLSALLSRLKIEAVAVPARRNAQISLISPVNTLLREAPTELRWRFIPESREYSGVIMRLNSRSSELIWKGTWDGRAEGKLPATLLFEPNQPYLWQITAKSQGAEIRSDVSWFAVLTADAATEVAAIELQYSDSALILLGAYEKYGLYADAQIQIDRLIALNADSTLVQTMARNLDRRRHLKNNG